MAGTQDSYVLWPKVLRHEVAVRVKNKVFVISTVVVMLLIAAGFALAAFLTSDDEPQISVAGIGEQADALVSASVDVAGGSDNVAVLDPYATEEDAREALGHGDVDAVLQEGDNGWVLLVDGSPEASTPQVLRQAIEATQVNLNAGALGVSVEDLRQGSLVAVEDVSAEEGVSSLFEQMLGLGFGTVFYMAVILFGTSIAQSVVTEKESRIIEILAAIVPLRQLLLGKILGSSIVAFIQMALFAGVIAIGLQVVDVGIDLSPVTSALLWFIPFFAVGFLALACIWAVSGAVASRAEDLNSTSLPLTLGLVLVLFSPMLLEGQWLTIMSFVPIFSSVLMPVRTVSGDVALWEPLLALGLVLVFCFIVLLIGERLYRKAAMHTSGTVSWKQMFAK